METMTMESPLKKVREGMKMSTADFAVLCGCSGASINFTENGSMPMPRKVKKKLQELGIDVEHLVREQEVFRGLRSEQLTQQAKESLRQAKA
jgi:transcriptional regulator with XRE-family HTH domain